MTIDPLVLSILLRFPADRVSAALSVVVSTVVRFLASGKSGSGALEEHYAAAAQKVQDRQVTTARELIEALRSAVPSDTMFNRDFSLLTVSKGEVARYLLRVLEAYESGRGTPALVPNPDVEAVNLEHILPKKPVLNWPMFSPEQVATYRYRLGNLALCETPVNSQMGNMSFAEKLPRLSASPFLTTREVGLYQDWRIEDIEHRQEKLASVAVKAWPFR